MTLVAGCAKWNRDVRTVSLELIWHYCGLLDD